MEFQSVSLYGFKKKYLLYQKLYEPVMKTVKSFRNRDINVIVY